MDVEKRLQSVFTSLSWMFNVPCREACTNVHFKQPFSGTAHSVCAAMRLSPSQRTHRTLSCCAALIETANSLSQAKWAGKNRGGGKT